MLIGWEMSCFELICQIYDRLYGQIVTNVYNNKLHVHTLVTQMTLDDQRNGLRNLLFKYRQIYDLTVCKFNR